MVKALGGAFITRFSVTCNCVRLSLLKLEFPMAHTGLRLKYSKKNYLEGEQCWRGEQRKEVRAKNRG